MILFDKLFYGCKHFYQLSWLEKKLEYNYCTLLLEFNIVFYESKNRKDYTKSVNDYTSNLSTSSNMV